MKHVLAENYERLFGKKLLKESVSVRSTGKTDSWNRPIYKDDKGNTYVDIDLGQEDEPNLHTVSSQGEPLDPVHDFTLNEIDDLDDHGDVGIGGGNTVNTSQSPMGFDEFMEAIQEYDVEGGFGSDIDSGYEIYYAPEDTIGFGKKFSADTPEDAYQKYLQYFKTQTTPMGGSTNIMGESNKIGKSMKHVLAENYERLFGRKLVKEDRVYSHILQGHEATEENAYDHARGLDWQEIPIKDQPLNSDHQYIDTVNGVGIYYNRMADYYAFTDETGQDLE